MSDRVARPKGYTEQVEDRAVEAAWKRRPYGAPTTMVGLRSAVVAAAPVIAEAAYRAGIEDARAEIDGLADTFKEVADKAMDVLPLGKVVARLPVEKRPKAAAEGTLRMAIEELRRISAALTDSEGRDE